MDVPVELLADDAWAAEDDITGFLNVVVGFLVYYICKDDQYPSPWCKLLLKHKNMINEDEWENWTNGEKQMIIDPFLFF